MSPLNNPGVDLTAHQASITPHVAEFLPTLLKGGNVMFIPTGAGWVSTLTGTGGMELALFELYLYTGATASSTTLLWAYADGFGDGTNTDNKINWNKKVYLIFKVGRETTCATAISHFQLKSVNTIGAMGAKGIGIKILNYALWTESYGSALGEIDMAVTLGERIEKQIVIVHDPSVPEIKWYVDGVLKATEDTPAEMPTGVPNETILATSIINGATAANAKLRVFQPKIWHER